VAGEIAQLGTAPDMGAIWKPWNVSETGTWPVALAHLNALPLNAYKSTAASVLSRRALLLTVGAPKTPSMRCFASQIGLLATFGEAVPLAIPGVYEWRMIQKN
jgi:hypothetical protein